MPELLLSLWFEVPVYCGLGRDLLSSFTGDTAQQKSLSCHGFSQGVHLRTGTMTLRYCRKTQEEDDEEEEGRKHKK